MARMVLGRVLMQHRPALLSVSLALALGACVGATDDEDPALAADGKADGFSPPWQGVLPVASGQGSVDVVFERPGGDPSSLAYVEFALSGPATISLETKYHRTEVAAWNEINRRLDTVLYVYQPTGDRWGSYLVKDDDAGYGKFSRLTVDLDAGSYRVLLKRKNGSGTPVTDLHFDCAGAGCAAAVEPLPVCADTDLSCMIANAVDLGDGANPLLTRELTLAALPVAVRGPARAATDELEQTDPDLDYSASVHGYYAVYRSQDDHTIVAYALWATGSGEPDYQDATVIGFGLDGARVYHEHDDF